MTKSEAIKLFNTVKELAAVLQCTRQAIYQWPEELPQRTADQVRGAALRKGIWIDPGESQLEAVG